MTSVARAREEARVQKPQSGVFAIEATRPRPSIVATEAARSGVGSERLRIASGLAALVGFPAAGLLYATRAPSEASFLLTSALTIVMFATSLGWPDPR